jgi:hypothetical protein
MDSLHYIWVYPAGTSSRPVLCMTTVIPHIHTAGEILSQFTASLRFSYEHFPQINVRWTNETDRKEQDCGSSGYCESQT